MTKWILSKLVKDARLIFLILYIAGLFWLINAWKTEDMPLIYEGYDYEIVECDTDINCQELNPHIEID
jgi:hypothetical protein